MLIKPSRYSKHFICVHMLPSMHSVVIGFCDINIHISTCCYLTISTSSAPRTIRLAYIIPTTPSCVFVTCISWTIRRTLIPHHLTIRWLTLRVELTFLSSQVNLFLPSQTTKAASRMYPYCSWHAYRSIYHDR
jgi:hypothetical protein